MAKDNTKIIQNARKIIDETAESISQEFDELLLQEAEYSAPPETQTATSNPAISMD